MILEQHYLGCLAHASYFLADEESGVAAVVDPQRDVGRYLLAAEQASCRIEHVFLTHLHADFVAGHLELAESTGAIIHLGARAQAEYEFAPADDGERISLGPGVQLEVLETPGHSPESISLVVYDLRSQSPGRPHAVLTGDTLFVGDVGRPDLRGAFGWSAEELGGMLYDSLHKKLLVLADETIVFPAHGPGTLCGKSLGSETQSTIGEQRAHNYALAPMSREEFVRIVSSDQPEAPAYFDYDAVLNSRFHPTLSESLERELQPLTPDEVREHQSAGALVLDTRPSEQFEAAHLPGTLNIGLDGRYATWAGTLIDAAREVVIVSDPGREHEATLRLGRIGFDRVSGYLDRGMSALAEHPELVVRAARLAPTALQERLDGSGEGPLLIDVRTESECAGELIDGAVNIPLARLPARMDELPRGRLLVPYCSSGYRSAIALSLLLGNGFERVADLAGGYAAWQAARGSSGSGPAAAPSAVRG